MMARYFPTVDETGRPVPAVVRSWLSGTFATKNELLNLAEVDLSQQASDAVATEISGLDLVTGETGAKRYARADRNTIHTLTDPTLARAARATLVTTPTYDGSGTAVHPSVYYNAAGWGGHRYWMTVTPYPGADNQLENPSVLCSDDGDTFQEPAGLTNPLDTAPGGGGFNSDPYLTVDNAGVMYCFWRQSSGGTDIQYYRTSVDGASWTPRATAQTLLDSGGAFRIVSPCTWQQADGSWVTYGVDTLASPRRIVRRTAWSPDGPWSVPQTVTITGNDGEPWHLDAHLVGGEYQLLVQDGGSGGGDLWVAVSQDGLDFTAGPNVIARGASDAWDRSYYKSCFVPAVRNGLAGWDTWVGGGYFPESGPIIGRTFTRFDEAGPDLTAEFEALSFRVDVLATKSGEPSPVLAFDDFNRADAGTLGDATTGQTWSAGFQIIGNQAAPAVDANSRAYVDVSATDYEVSATVSGPVGNQHWLMARFTDVDNYWRFGVQADGSMALQQIAGGGITVNSAAAIAGTYTGDAVTLMLRCTGTAIEALVDGVVADTETEGALTTGTVVGLQANRLASRFDDFTVKAV